MPEQAQSLGFIGLGVMGGPMCRNVVTKHGAPVTAFDPACLHQRREEWDDPGE